MSWVFGGLIDRPVAWRFRVTVDRINGNAEFTECSGLSVERETDDLIEGGLNHYVHKLPKGFKYSSPITLKRGIVSLDLWKWFAEGMDRSLPLPDLRTVTIELANTAGEVAVTWVVKEAYPSKWTGPTLSAVSQELAMEELELVHHGFTVQAGDGLTPATGIL